MPAAPSYSPTGLYLITDNPNKSRTIARDDEGKADYVREASTCTRRCNPRDHATGTLPHKAMFRDRHTCPAPALRLTACSAPPRARCLDR